MTSLRELLILDLDRARHGFGSVGEHAVLLRSPVCGDEVAVDIARDGDVLRSFVWRGHGCTVSMASASALALVLENSSVPSFAAAFDAFTELVDGPAPSDDELPTEPAETLRDAVAFAGIGRIPLRAGCATLAWKAVERALRSDPGVSAP